jgi:hypothetical protein
MFGEAGHLAPLETRKRLLIAESELNRARLSQEWQTMADEVHVLADRAKTMGAWAAAAALLGAGLLAGRRGRPASRVAKRSWFKQVLGVARLVSTVWVAARAVGQRR